MVKFRKNDSFIIREGGMNQFMKEISKFPLLTREQEAAAARAHDLNKLVCHNLRFAVRAAKSYSCSGDMYELLQCACEGMVKAAKLYDVDKSGVRFITYAQRFMLSEMVEYLRRENTTLKRDDYYLAGRIARFCEQYVAENGMEPTVEEIADALGEKDDRVLKAMTDNHPRTSINAPVDEDGDLEYGDHIGGDLDADVYTCNNDRKVAVALALKKYVTPKEATVLRMFYGLGTQTMSVDDIAYELDLTRQRVNQLKKSALTKLQKVVDLKEMF